MYINAWSKLNTILLPYKTLVSAIVPYSTSKYKQIAQDKEYATPKGLLFTCEPRGRSGFPL